ncbi:MAG: DUF5103 domain-containing protein [Prevotella sp.]|nr:DUF5103 domain-containing protein [Prevotella sp.]
MNIMTIKAKWTLPLLVVALWCAGMTVAAKNIIYSDNIKTLTSVVNNDWLSEPLLVLGTNDVMRVGFDEMSHDYHRYVYRIEHCENDWSTSEDIFESDWLDGFNGLTIDNMQNSINTNVLYTHYSLEFPDSRCSVKMSGNYRMKICDEDNGGEVVAEVRFRVLEPLMAMSMTMTSNTDIGVNKSHQQISVKLDYGSVNITNPDEELMLVVTQNNRDETARRGVRYNFRNNRGLEWQHNKSLIFPGGNEYHKFEILDVSHPTMGIDKIFWDGGSYQVYPFACQQSDNYLYDEDANGAFFIRNSDNTEIDYTCEYVFVNYELHSPYVGPVSIDGMWTTDADKSRYAMEYDSATQTYSVRIMQKLGYYNYMFTAENGQAAKTEGSYYQTENSYQAYIYYKGTGARTWRLVGFRGLR